MWIADITGPPGLARYPANLAISLFDTAVRSSIAADVKVVLALALVALARWSASHIPRCLAVQLVSSGIM